MVKNQIKNSMVKTCMLFIRNGVLYDEKAVSGFADSQECQFYELSPDKLRELVLRILISEGILNGAHVSSPISARGKRETLPVTGRSTLSLTGVDGCSHFKSVLVPITVQSVLSVLGVNRTHVGEVEIVHVRGLQETLPVKGVKIITVP